MGGNNTKKAAEVRVVKDIIKKMKEPTRTSVTLGKSEMFVVLPILEKVVADSGL